MTLPTTKRLAIGLFCVLLTGCYFVKQGIGQLSISHSATPVGEAAPKLPPEDRGKLKLIADIKRFAEERIGLTRSDSFTTFYDTSGKPVSYVVMACRKDRLQEHVWHFPIVGPMPYKGYFDLEDARHEARRLQEKSYDVIIRPAQAYSTLGWFKDPVYSTFLKLSKAELANLILHELVHGTVFSINGEFNESLASFVAVEAGKQYLAGDAEALKEFEDRAADEATFESYMRAVRDTLEALYRSDAPDKMKRREEIFAAAQEEFKKLPFRRGGYEAPTNNAEVLANLRYRRYSYWLAVFESSGRDWAKFLARARAAAAHPDPFRALQP